jgi:importin subunit alpha-2
LNAAAVAGFISLLGPPFLVVVEKTVWALGDVAGDGPELRDHVIEQGIIKPLLQLIVLETWLNLINLII